MKYIDVSGLPIYNKVQTIIRLADTLEQDHKLYNNFLVLEGHDDYWRSYGLPTNILDKIFSSTLERKYYTTFPIVDNYNIMYCFFNNLKELIVTWDKLFSDIVFSYVACKSEHSEDMFNLFQDKLDQIRHNNELF